MRPTRYPQFCALARAAEVLGERWTLLIVRELLLGPKRFSDLRGRLDGISPSVLTERLGRAQELGVVRRSVLPPPAASSVYELTETGLALRPVVHELIRWGGRFLFPARKRERIEPEWMGLALEALARAGPSPQLGFMLRVHGGQKEGVIHVAGGPKGTTVQTAAAPADVTLVLSVKTLAGLMSGLVSPYQAIESGVVEASGDLNALAKLPELFDITVEPTQGKLP